VKRGTLAVARSFTQRWRNSSRPMSGEARTTCRKARSASGRRRSSSAAAQQFGEALREDAVAHAVRDDVDRHAGAEAAELVEHVGHLAPGVARVLFVADVGQQFSIRGPTEEHRRAGESEVPGQLRGTLGGIGEGVLETVNEKQHAGFVESSSAACDLRLPVSRLQA